MDIEHAAHLIAVFGLEAAGIEIYIPGQFGIDETQSFLLAAAHEIGAENLKVVDVDQVLIVITAPHAVLRREFVVAAYQCFDHGFDAAGGTG